MFSQGSKYLKAMGLALPTAKAGKSQRNNFVTRRTRTILVPARSKAATAENPENQKNRSRSPPLPPGIQKLMTPNKKVIQWLSKEKNDCSRSSNSTQSKNVKRLPLKNITKSSNSKALIPKTGAVTGTSQNDLNSDLSHLLMEVPSGTQPSLVPLNTLSLAPSSARGNNSESFVDPILTHDLVTPEEEVNDISCRPIQSIFNTTPDESDIKFHRGGISVRKNLFPADNSDENIFILGANEALTSQLDSCGGSITLMVDNLPAELHSGSSPCSSSATLRDSEFPSEPDEEGNKSLFEISKRKRKNITNERGSSPKKRIVDGISADILLDTSSLEQNDHSFMFVEIPSQTENENEDNIHVIIPEEIPNETENENDIHVILPEETDTEKNRSNANKRKRKAVVSEKTPTKKRAVNRNEWKSTKIRVANQSGQAHVSRRGLEKRERALQPPCGEKCRRKCTSRVSEELRQRTLKKYWSLEDKTSQWMYLSKLVKAVAIKRRKVEVDDEDEAYRKNTYEYYISSNPEEKSPSPSSLIPVCQVMFLATFDISISVVKTTFNKSSPDKRGRHGGGKKRLSPTLIESVKQHIKRFPLVESHYCRADSRKKYLDENLNVAKMHRMYLLTRDADDPHKATVRQYRDIFNTCFNLSFFKPKKDQCSECLEFNSCTQSSELQVEVYNNHQQEKVKVRALKKEDKLISRDKQLSITSGSNVKTVTFDLQKVLYCPKSENSELFYRRKFSCYNFTMFDCTVKQAHNYFWDMTIGMKGSDEINSFICDYIESEVNNGVNDFRFYSDSCGGQNKNKFLFSMYYMLSMKHKIKIVHRWLVKGHTQMECDSVHARIEKKTRSQSVFTPSEWLGHIGSAKVRKPKYKVTQATQDSIFSFRELADFFVWKNVPTSKLNVPTSKLREINFDHKEPGVVSYKETCEGELTKVNILAKRRGRPINWATQQLKKAYSGPLPVKSTLLEDLKYYIRKNVIPTAHQQFYEILFERAASASVPPPPEDGHEEENEFPEEVVQHVELDDVSEGEDEDDPLGLSGDSNTREPEIPESDGDADMSNDSDCDD